MKVFDPFLAGSIVVAIALLTEKTPLIKERSRSDARSKDAWL